MEKKSTNSQSCCYSNETDETFEQTIESGDRSGTALSSRILEVLPPHEHEVERYHDCEDEVFVVGEIHSGFGCKNYQRYNCKRGEESLVEYS